MNAMTNRILLCAAVVIAMFIVGCEAPDTTIANPQLTLPPQEASPEYLDRVSSLNEVNENDAMRGLLMLIEGTDESQTFEQRVFKLQAMNVVPSSWSFDAKRSLTRGKLAYMISQALDIRGGVVMMLAGPSQRYSLKELQFMGIMAPGATLTTVSGGEFVAVLARADAYRQTGTVPEVLRAGGL